METKAEIAYVCNIMTQRGETEHFTDSDHVEVLHRHLGRPFIDTVLVNIEKVPQEYMNSNRFDEYLVQVEHDFVGLCKQVSRVISSNFLRLENGGAFHDGDLIVDELMRIIQVKNEFHSSSKEEILGQHHLSWHELSAIIKMSGSIGLSTSGLTLSVVTENAKLARHLYESFLHFYEIKSEIRHHQRSNLRKNRVYTVFTDEKVQDLLSDLHLADSFFGLETGIDEAILSDEEAGRAYLCGAFLANGSIRDPESGKYQLEISSVYLDHAQGIASLLQQFYWMPRCLSARRGL